MQTIGARDLKQHTGEVIARVMSGERLVLTMRGHPVALITPVDQGALDAALARELAKAEGEGWLAVAEGAFSFWDNEEDAVWDHIPVR